MGSFPLCIYTCSPKGKINLQRIALRNILPVCEKQNRADLIYYSMSLAGSSAHL